MALTASQKEDTSEAAGAGFSFLPAGSFKYQGLTLELHSSYCPPCGKHQGPSGGRGGEEEI